MEALAPLTPGVDRHDGAARFHERRRHAKVRDVESVIGLHKVYDRSGPGLDHSISFIVFRMALYIENPDPHMKQPHEDIIGSDRTGDPLVSLQDEHLPVRSALIAVTRNLSTATLGGNPSPVVERMGERIRTPRAGDLVMERTTAFMRRPGWHRGFGYLVERRREWWHTNKEWAQELAEDGYTEHEPRPTDDAWYIQFGPAAVDICRWTDCSFLVVPVGNEDFSRPRGRDGSGVTFTLGGLPLADETEPSPLELTRQAVFRFITKTGATVADVSSSYCDIAGYTPDGSTVRANLDRLVGLRELRLVGGRYFDPGADNN